MSMTNRQIAAQETKKKLLCAGKKLICEKGLANTSVEEITSKAGVSKGTFYTYFKRKEDIVSELSGDAFLHIMENAKDFDGSFYEKLTFYMENFSGYIENSSVQLAQEWIRSVVNPNFCQNVFDSGKLTCDLSYMEGFIEDSVSKGELKEQTPVRQLSHILVDLLYGELLCWCMSDGCYSLRERTREFCDTQLRVLFKNYINQNLKEDTKA